MCHSLLGGLAQTESNGPTCQLEVTLFAVNSASCVYTCSNAFHILTVSGFEKRGNFAQNAKFWHFLSYHHFKAVRASDFILSL